MKTLRKVLHSASCLDTFDLLSAEFRIKKNGKNRKNKKMYMEDKFWKRTENSFIDTAYKLGYEGIS
jgi:hypothetical protein